MLRPEVAENLGAERFLRAIGTAARLQHPHAIAQPRLGADCVAHARMFFNRPDFDLASAVCGSFALAPHHAMIEQLRVGGVHPGIVVGQLQRRLNRWDLFRPMLAKIRDVITTVAVTDGYGRIVAQEIRVRSAGASGTLRDLAATKLPHAAAPTTRRG